MRKSPRYFSLASLLRSFTYSKRRVIFEAPALEYRVIKQ